MVASVAEAVLRRFGPFVVPVILFAAGVVGYTLLWLFYRWRDGWVVEESEPGE